MDSFLMLGNRLPDGCSASSPLPFGAKAADARIFT